ncbi:killer cell lectin-like receptor subfamily G member 1 [Prionailurus iriomotensis]
MLSTEPPAQNDYRPEEKGYLNFDWVIPHMVPSSEGAKENKVPSLAPCGDSFGTSERPSYVFAACPVDSVPRRSTRASCPSCPDFWVRYGDHCYYFSVEKNNWDSSLDFCLAEDSHLLMLTGNQEMVDILG